MSTNDAKRGPLVVCELPDADKELLPFSKGMIVSCTSNKYLPNVGPLIVTFTPKVDAYDKACTAAETKAKGTTAHRNAMRVQVIADVYHIRDHVQGVVELQPTLALATAVAESVGMRLRKPGAHTKGELSAENGAPQGTVELEAKAVARVASYYWQYSLDQVSWVSVPETLQARTVISGLLSARVYYFRFRALTRKGVGDFSQVVSLLVR